ncbi:hypothetical protein PM076_14625 [Halorubrum ezzemoulense]|nr:hypothetical protein [Halorubrum ezzemoulense]MDB2297520.1 hypothetical protein [Halorubrum ezzemoulense]
MVLDDFLDIEGSRLQVKLVASDDEGLIVDPSVDIRHVRHPVRITDGTEKIEGAVPDHRVLVELTSQREARLISTFGINREL